jgi:energy-coupling factor transport system ATP-binding protein
VTARPSCTSSWCNAVTPIPLSDPILDLRGVDFAYGEALPAIRGLSLCVGAGCFLAVVGANGSGKSTLARLLDGLLLPTAGRVLVDGLDTADPATRWEVRRRVGLVFQNPDNQIVASIVEDDVAFGPENLGIAPELIRRRVDASLAAVGMSTYRRRAPDELSGGQKQRVAIAGALAMEPRVLVLDEPTAMLDPDGREEVMEVLRGLHARGMTVVLITHYMEEAAQAERVVVMHQGHIVDDDAPARVFSQGHPGLDLPPAAEMAQALAAAGLRLPPGIVTIEALAEAVRPLVRRAH